MIRQNIEKTRFTDKSEILQQDYKKALKNYSVRNIKFDIVFLDPPYKKDIAVDAVQDIIELGLLEKNGVIIIETDEKERELKELEKLQVEVYDLRKYGRVNLIFLNRKE